MSEIVSTIRRSGWVRRQHARQSCFKQFYWILFRRVLALGSMAAVTTVLPQGSPAVQGAGFFAARVLPEIRFAHPTEAMFAAFLDFHGIQWQYEPRTFPVEWDNAGNVREAFTPDFYLTELDLYVELTMMKQSLIRRKNRKLRLMRELYPEANIRVLYQKDLEDLQFKLGLGLRPAAA
jgi:hypothetical protein